MPFPSANPSLWALTAGSVRFPPLGPRALEVDVAVVGAGMVGVTAAWLLRRGGRRVALLEGGRVGSAATGHSTGKVTALQGTLYQRLLREHGREKAVLYAEANRAAVETLAALVEEEGLDCGLERVADHVFAEDEEQRLRVLEEVEAARSVHLPVEACDDPGLPFPVLAAARLDRQLQVHPCRYLRALAERMGKDVYEDTRVLDVEGSGPFKLRTSEGLVEAGQVVVATGMPILRRGAFFARAWPYYSYGLAARVPPEAAVSGTFLNAGRPLRSVRTAVVDGETHLVCVGHSHRAGEGDPVESHLLLEEWAGKAFPLGEVVARWCARDFASTDLLPLVGPALPGGGPLYVATGFGGWGLSNGVAAAMHLADTLLERPTTWGKLYDPLRLTPSAVGRMASEGLKAAAGMVADRLEAAREDDDVPPGEGRVVRRGGHSLALYRDLQGNLHARSATCPHLGCVVHWNGADKTWDCPCHGSRFDRLGEVLEGPAVQGLAPREVEVRLRT